MFETVKASSSVSVTDRQFIHWQVKINFKSRPQSNNLIANPCRRQWITEYKIWHNETKSKKGKGCREGAEIERASERRVGRTDCFQHGVIKLVLDNRELKPRRRRRRGRRVVKNEFIFYKQNSRLFRSARYANGSMNVSKPNMQRGRSIPNRNTKN